MERHSLLNELDMQELEPMEAPFWATAASVVTGITAVSGVGYTVFKVLTMASVTVAT